MKLARLPHALIRLVRNVHMDLRYGGLLGGAVEQRYPGAKTVGSTDYALMQQIFGGRIRDHDVLVDVGCGKGRVLNWWLENYPHHRMVGLELMEEVAAATAHRLRNFPNVRVISGDAIANLPTEATLFYLFNPFNAAIMVRFKDRMRELCRARPECLILYFAPVHIDVFQSDPDWTVKLHEIKLPPAGNFEDRHHRLAEISLAVRTST